MKKKRINIHHNEWDYLDRVMFIHSSWLDPLETDRFYKDTGWFPKRSYRDYIQ